MRSVALLAALVIVACSSDPSTPSDAGPRDTGTADSAVDVQPADAPTTPPLCTPGTQINCGCLGGAMGVQVCGPSGAYGACTCPDAGAGLDAPDVAAVDASSDAVTDHGTDGASGTDAVAPTDAADAPATLDLGAMDTGADAPPATEVGVDAATDVAVDVSCPAGQTRCGGACVDTRTSADHCGACDSRCAPPNGAGVCIAGSCEVGACVSPYRDCDSSGANGCETDTRTSVAHCGGCGMACPARPHATASCAAASCVYACEAGWGDCDGAAANGCETNTQSGSWEHCGSCDNACPAGPNSVPTCSAGVCGITCLSTNFGDCDGNPFTGCESVFLIDRANCGRCGRACATAQSCSLSCMTIACTDGDLRCSPDASSVERCVGGAWTTGSACAGGQVCSGGACVAPPCVHDAVRCNDAGTAVERCVGNRWTTLRTCALAAGDAFVGFCQDSACRACRRGDGGVTSGCGAATCTTNDDCLRLRWGLCVGGQCARRGYLPCTGDPGCLPWAVTGASSTCSAAGTDANGASVRSCSGSSPMPCTANAMCPNGYRCDLRNGRCVTP